MKSAYKYLVGYVSLLLLLIAGTIGIFAKYISHVFLNLINQCQTILHSIQITAPETVLFGTVVLFVFLAFISTVRFTVSFIRIKRLKKNVLAYSQISVYAYELISKLQLTGIVKVVHNNKPYAFCSGLVKRHIYLSSGLVDLASSRELEAILRHEKHHLKNRDPLTRFLAHAAHALFPWFPVLGDLASRCRLDQEIKADKAAIQGLGSKKPLITVLKKLLVYDSCEVYPVISFYSQNLFEKRISALFNNKGYAYSITFSSSLVTLISLGFFIWVLFIPMSADVQSAQADTADCLKNQMCSINCLK